MRRNILAALVLVAASALGGAFILEPITAKVSASRTSTAKAATSPAPVGSGSPFARVAVDADHASDPERAPLDCQAPEGDVLRINETTISAESFCDELAALTGAAPETPTEAWRRQARQLKEQIIDAELVRAALAEERATIDESAVAEAMAGLRRAQGGDEVLLRG